jgi:hypothetical protein
MHVYTVVLNIHADVYMPCDDRIDMPCMPYGVHEDQAKSARTA